MRKAYTPAELRDLAASRRKNPYYADESAAALVYAADVIEAADKAIAEELEKLLPPGTES